MKTNLQDIYNQLETSKSFDELADELVSINVITENGKKIHAYFHYDDLSFRWIAFKNPTATPATKSQLDALIDLCLDGGYNEAAGLLKLGSETLSAAIRAHDQDEFTQADEQERNDLYTLGMGA